MENSIPLKQGTNPARLRWPIVTIWIAAALCFVGALSGIMLGIGQFFQGLAIFAAMAITLAVALVGLRRTRVYYQSSGQSGEQIDLLTTMPNKQRTLQRLDEELKRAKRTSSSLSVALLDVEDVKNVSRERGARGEKAALRQTARLLREKLRTYDFVGRYDEGEFAIILPGTQNDKGRVACERIRHSVEQQLSHGTGTEKKPVSVPVGIASLQNEDVESKSILLRADEALHKAKAALQHSRA